VTSKVYTYITSETSEGIMLDEAIPDDELEVYSNYYGGWYP
jgi:hypothetical protein